MKTVVYQSYRTTRVPPWIATCMESVKSWAAANGFEYRLFDDRFFEYAPDWFRERANHQICPVTDLARLVAAREFLAEGFDKTIWVDADVLVFAPEKLVVDTSAGFTLCREVWPYAGADGHRGATRRVNNCIAAFERGTIYLEFLIDACLRIARHKTSLGKLDVGTAFLTRLRGIVPFPLLNNVGTFSPAIVAEMALGEGPKLREYAKALTHPLACGNFCASLLESDSVAEAAVSRCLATRGALVNDLIQPGRLPSSSVEPLRIAPKLA